IRRAPETGIARPVVDELELGVVAVPGPGRAATALPLVAGIGHPEIVSGGAKLRIVLVGFGRESHLVVRAVVPVSPDQLAGREIVGLHPSTRRELVATETG